MSVAREWNAERKRDEGCRRDKERYSEKDMITINPRFVKSNCIK